MNKHFLFAFLLLSISPTFSQLWEKLSIPEISTSSYFIDLEVVDENVVWVLTTSVNHNPATTYPLALLTVDGGKTWKRKIIPPASNRVSYDIVAFDETTAIITSNKLVASDTRPIFKTVNGGDTWKTITPPDRTGGVHIHFFDKLNGLVLNSGLASVSKDGGDTWELKPEFQLISNEYFTFWNGTKNKFFAIGDYFWIGSDAGRIFKSKDKGNTWEIFQAAKTNESIDKLIFTDTLNGYALITGTGLAQYNKSIFYQTSDGGKKWKKMDDLDFNAHFMGINESNNEIYLANEFSPNIFRKNKYLFDSENWEECYEELVVIYGLEFYNNVGYAIGRDENDKNIILKLNDQTNDTEELTEKNSKVIFPNPTTGILHFKNELLAGSIIIRDNSGRILVKEKISNLSYDIQKFESGVYHITLVNGSKSFHEKIIKI